MTTSDPPSDDPASSAPRATWSAPTQHAGPRTRYMPGGPAMIELAHVACVGVRTIRRVYDGGGDSYSRERIRRGAEQLGMPPPPPPNGE